MKLRIFSFFKLSTLRQWILRTSGVLHRIAECAVVSVSTRGKIDEIANFFFFLTFDFLAQYSVNERCTESSYRMRCRFFQGEKMNFFWKNNFVLLEQFTKHDNFIDFFSKVTFIIKNSFLKAYIQFSITYTM